MTYTLRVFFFFFVIKGEQTREGKDDKEEETKFLAF